MRLEVATFFKNLAVRTSTLTGEARIKDSFNVPVTTTRSKLKEEGDNSICKKFSPSFISICFFHFL